MCIKAAISLNGTELEGMDQFLDLCDQPKLNGDKTNNLNVPMTSSEIDVMKFTLKNNKYRTQVWMGSMQNFTNCFLKSIRMLPNSFYIALPDSKTAKDTTASKKNIVDRLSHKQ